MNKPAAFATIKGVKQLNINSKISSLSMAYESVPHETIFIIGSAEVSACQHFSFVQGFQAIESI